MAMNTGFHQSTAEFTNDGYETFMHNLDNTTGRGIIIHADTRLQAYNVKLHSTFQKYLSVCTKLENGEQLLITSLFRSPSSPEENNHYLNKLTKEIDNTPMAYKLVIGDFNYPIIEWNNLHRTPSNKEAKELRETTLACYMSQLVTFAIRARGEVTPSCIDWVVANTEDIVNDIISQSPLANSDHVLIECDLKVQPRDEGGYGTKLYYDKGDYDGMLEFVRTEMQDLPTSTDVDTIWDFLTNILHEAKDTSERKR